MYKYIVYSLLVLLLNFMYNLFQILDLSGCQWFHAHSFLALSKSKTLKELHLKGCLGIEDCVPYASLAATFGFPSLEVKK